MKRRQKLEFHKTKNTWFNWECYGTRWFLDINKGQVTHLSNAVGLNQLPTHPLYKIYPCCNTGTCVEIWVFSTVWNSWIIHKLMFTKFFVSAQKVFIQQSGSHWESRFICVSWPSRTADFLIIPVTIRSHYPVYALHAIVNCWIMS